MTTSPSESTGPGFTDPSRAGTPDPMNWLQKQQTCGQCDCLDISECIYTQPEQKWPSTAEAWIHITLVILASWLLVALLVTIIVMFW